MNFCRAGRPSSWSRTFLTTSRRRFCSISGRRPYTGRAWSSWCRKRVASRMVADVGAADYGVLSIVSRYRAEVDIVHRVPRTCFRPQPKVDSCIVRLRAREKPLYPDAHAKLLFGLVKRAFAQRRKTLRNSIIRSGFGAGKEALPGAFDAAGHRSRTKAPDTFAGRVRVFGESDSGVARIGTFRAPVARGLCMQSDFGDRILDSITSGVIAVDREGRVVTANRSACTHIHVDSEALRPGTVLEEVSHLGPMGGSVPPGDGDWRRGDAP